MVRSRSEASTRSLPRHTLVVPAMRERGTLKRRNSVPRTLILLVRKFFAVTTSVDRKSCSVRPQCSAALHPPM